MATPPAALATKVSASTGASTMSPSTSTRPAACNMAAGSCEALAETVSPVCSSSRPMS